jgi:WD40 repeat protein
VAQPPIANAEPTIDDVKSDIMRVSAEGKEPTMLVREEKSDLRIIRAPNSDQIAYLIRGLENYGPLKLIDGAGGPARLLSQQDDHVTAFFWSPDGTQLAFLSDRDGSFEIYVMKADGSEPLNYRWTFNGSDIEGATGTNLTLSTVTPQQAGEYAVVIIVTPMSRQQLVR